MDTGNIILPALTGLIWADAELGYPAWHTEDSIVVGHPLELNKVMVMWKRAGQGQVIREYWKNYEDESFNKWTLEESVLFNEDWEKIVELLSPATPPAEPSKE